MIIIPAVDIKDGRCVRLFKGDFEQSKEYYADPLSAALHWQDEGAALLHVVDLDGARTGTPVHSEKIAEMARRLAICIEVGGGIRTEETISLYLAAGVTRVIIGTQALRDPGWLERVVARFPGRICLGLDCVGGRVAIEGWKTVTEKLLTATLRELASLPLAAVIVTEISRDGTMQGAARTLFREIAPICPHPLVASGGVSTLADIRDLASLKLQGAIVGKALYEGAFTVREAQQAAEEGSRL